LSTECGKKFHSLSTEGEISRLWKNLWITWRKLWKIMPGLGKTQDTLEC